VAASNAHLASGAGEQHPRKRCAQAFSAISLQPATRQSAARLHAQLHARTLLLPEADKRRVLLADWLRAVTTAFDSAPQPAE
jgi:hypothetical protein